MTDRITIEQYIQFLQKLTDPDDLTKFTMKSSLHDITDCIGWVKKRTIRGTLRSEYLGTIEKEKE